MKGILISIPCCIDILSKFLSMVGNIVEWNWLYNKSNPKFTRLLFLNELKNFLALKIYFFFVNAIIKRRLAKGRVQRSFGHAVSKEKKGI